MTTPTNPTTPPAKTPTERVKRMSWPLLNDPASKAVLLEDALSLARELEQAQAEIARLRELREGELSAALRNYEEALLERNKAWRKSDEIEAENATRITRDQYREREVKSLQSQLAASKQEIAGLRNVIGSARAYTKVAGMRVEMEPHDALMMLAANLSQADRILFAAIDAAMNQNQGEKP